MLETWAGQLLPALPEDLPVHSEHLEHVYDLSTMEAEAGGS